jgi:hypothetical protein
MHRSIQMAILMATILVALPTTLVAQQTGSIVGTVADQTGATISHAKVMLVNEATRDTRATTSNVEGFFAFSGVVSGDYGVKVDAQGFRGAELKGIHLSPDDRRNLNVSLAVATQNASVTVVADSSAITVDSGDLSSTLDSTYIRKLALQGRDVTELIKTLPGFNTFTNFGGIQNKAGYDTTVTSIQSAVGNAVNANGIPSRAGGADLVSDGAHILDPGCNCNALQTVNADMVAEVKVTTSAYGADSVTGPVVISAVSKSGTSEYHGSAYLHFRDGAMNSNDWIFKHNLQKRPNERYWYPGGQVSGPVPYTHKKLLGFVGYEYYNQLFPEQTSGGLLKSNVPTLSERGGKFDPTLPDNAAACQAMSSSVSGGWDPKTQAYGSSGYRCQTWNTIAIGNGAGSTVVTGIQNEDVSAYLQPGALAMLNEIPKPNRTPTQDLDYNYVKPLINTNNGYMFHTRVDYNLSDNTKAYISYNQQHELYGQPVMRWWLASDAVDYPGGVSDSAHSKTLSASLVKVFSPSTTNEFLADLGYLDSPNSLGNEKAVDKAATKYPYSYPTTSKILPSIYNTWWNNDFGVPFQYDAGRYAYFIHKVQPSFTDNFTKVLKTHTLKFGASWLGVWDKEANVNQSDGPNGTIGYGPDWSLPTGAWGLDPVLNFMTDRVGSFNAAPLTNNDMKGYTLGFYGQDEWKATKRLTLNLGLRLAHDTPYEDATGKWGVPAWTQDWYDSDVAKGITDLPGMRWHGADATGIHSLPSIPLSGHTLNTFFYGPRFGVAYDAFGTGKTVLRGGLGAYYYRDGLGGSAGTAAPQGGTTCTITSSAFLSQITASSVQCANTNTGVTNAGANDPHDHTEPLTLTYNFTVSEQTIAKTQLEISYVGSQTSDLINPLSGNLNNMIPIGAYMKPDPNPASANYGQILPIDVANGSAAQDYKPLTHYSGFGLINHGSWANYNALQVSWSKREGSLTYNLNYTWSKTLGINSSAVDPFDLNKDYGVLSADRTHVLNATYAYEVGNPFKRNRLEGAILNGWMVAGITAIQSGAPMAESFSMNMGFGGTDILANTDPTDPTKPNTHSPNTINSAYFLGSPAYTLTPKVTCNPAGGLKSRQYVNPNCFSIPSLPQIDPSTGVLTALGGRGPLQMPYFRAPKYVSNDLSASRTIRISERQNAQIKFSATNWMNHPLISFDQGNANNLNLNYTTGVLATSGAASGGTWAYGVPNEKFGRRVLEMSLRYSF